MAALAADLGVGRLLEMMTSARLLGVFVLMVSAVAACREASETEHPSTQETQGKSAAVVAALTLESQPAKVVLQAVLDATDGDASLAACNALLDTPLRIVTTEAKPFAVIMAMVVTQLSATMTVDGAKWTALCPAAEGAGTLFRRGQAPTSVVVAKVPAESGS